MTIKIEQSLRIGVNNHTNAISFAVSSKQLNIIDAQETINDLWTIELKPWRPKRSLKQNAKFHATLRGFVELCQRAANSSGYSVDDIKTIVKEEAIKRGYPIKITKVFGKELVRPKPSSEATTSEMAMLIDTAEEVIAKIEGGIYD